MAALPRKRKLESLLQDVSPFSSPKVELEQYPTPAGLAAEVLLQLEREFGAIVGKSVCDLGCGTGMLGIGADLLGASWVVGVDVDGEVLQEAEVNARGLGSSVEFLRADGSKVGWRDGMGVFDTVVMNPPFGTRKAGVDVALVKAALQMAPVVFSMHKSSTRDFLLKSAEEWGAEASLVTPIAFPIPRMYAHHTDDKVSVEVDLLLFRRKESGEGGEGGGGGGGGGGGM